MPLQGNKLRSLGLAVRSQPLLLELCEENVAAWPLTAMLLMLHTITGARPQEGADWPTERGVETTRVFKTGASFVTDNRNNK